MEREEEIRFDPIHRTNRLSEWLGEEEEVADGKEVVVLVHIFLGMKGSGELPVSDTFADIGATVADNFEVEAPMIGMSLLEKLI